MSLIRWCLTTAWWRHTWLQFIDISQLEKRIIFFFSWRLLWKPFHTSYLPALMAAVRKHQQDPTISNQGRICIPYGMYGSNFSFFLSWCSDWSCNSFRVQPGWMAMHWRLACHWNNGMGFFFCFFFWEFKKKKRGRNLLVKTGFNFCGELFALHV